MVLVSFPSFLPLLARRSVFLLAVLLASGFFLFAPHAHAGAQIEEALMPSVVAGLQRSLSDRPIPNDYANRPDVLSWVSVISPKLAKRLPDERERNELLATLHYEGTRAGLDLQLLLGVIHHESGFKKYAVSVAGARGYMQVMPFWVKLIGNEEQNLFHLRTNLRYGCVILRHYLDRENGDLFRALGRYNGSLGRAEYPNAVAAAMKRYEIQGTVVGEKSAATASASRNLPASVNVY
ncbi:MAG: lytic transglycosylase domain-containing protein [Burkholderiales bacterium]|jgi:soluble lytic murein transglycosylase-like protein|nr:lytic transglycosylase domain-containing protein [Burkholderiales bacterium]